MLQAGSSEGSNPEADDGEPPFRPQEIDMNTIALSARPEHDRRGLQRVLDHYAIQSPFSTPGRHAARFDALPSHPAGVARAVQGLLIYEHVAEAFYGYALPAARRAESHLRPLEKIVDALLALDNHPLHISRPSEKRLVGICRHFMLFSLAIFRHHGIPARGRGGFGTYFNAGKFEDHWVCEYWKEDENRWALLDSQFDEIFVRNLAIGHDVHDVPSNLFLTASDAWHRCRAGELDPELFGIEFSGLRGLWFIAGSLVRDLATLNGREILPWDVWGAQPSSDATVGGGTRFLRRHRFADGRSGCESRCVGAALCRGCASAPVRNCL
jgi:hypothetical protein